MSTPLLILICYMVMVLHNVFTNENLKDIRRKIFCLLQTGVLVLHLKKYLIVLQ